MAKESGESFRNERVAAAKISEPCKKRKAPASEKRVATRPASKRAEMAARAIAKQESEDEGIDSDSDAQTDEDSKPRPAARSNVCYYVHTWCVRVLLSFVRSVARRNRALGRSERAPGSH